MTQILRNGLDPDGGFSTHILSRMGLASSGGSLPDNSTGSSWEPPGGGLRASVLYSLIASCQRLGVEPFAYLRDVLDRVSTHPSSRIWELTPRGWRDTIGRELAEGTPRPPSSLRGMVSGLVWCQRRDDGPWVGTVRCPIGCLERARAYERRDQGEDPPEGRRDLRYAGSSGSARAVRRRGEDRTVVGLLFGPPLPGVLPRLEERAWVLVSFSSCSQPCLDASLVLIRRRSHLLRLLEEIADPRGLCMVIAQQEAHQAIRIEGLHRARFRKALRRPASMSSGESGLLARAFDESIPNTCCKVSEPLTYQWEFGKTPCACATLKPWSRREALS